jgi:hypothetical protein
MKRTANPRIAIRTGPFVPMLFGTGAKANSPQSVSSMLAEEPRILGKAFRWERR